MDPVKNILKSKKNESKIYCFECGEMIPQSDWLDNPSDTYGCSRHI